VGLLVASEMVLTSTRSHADSKAATKAENGWNRPPPNLYTMTAAT